MVKLFGMPSSAVYSHCSTAACHDMPGYFLGVRRGMKPDTASILLALCLTLSLCHVDHFMCSYAASLEELVLAGNPALEGPIPDGMATLAFLKTADITGTSMNCSTSPSTKACAQPLPCFLQFAGYQVPMGSDQRCSAVVPKTPQQAARSCPQFANGLLAANAAARGSELPGAGLMGAGMQGMGAQWKMDSSYYQQATCQCGADSIELWNPTRTALRCQPR